MLTRLVPERARDVLQCALYVIGGVKYWITVRCVRMCVCWTACTSVSEYARPGTRAGFES